jgi:hypothetical protein
MSFDSKDFPTIGKSVGRDNGEMMNVKLAIEQGEHSWNLIAYNIDGVMQGVAAFGPIESLPIIIQLLRSLGAKPKRINSSPIGSN